MSMEMKMCMTAECFHKVRALFNGTDSEVGALMLCDIDYESGKILINDIKVTKQDVTGADVDFDEDAISDLIFESVCEGYSTKLCGWIHSHYNMNAFWSNTDEKTIEKLRTYIDNVLVSIVGNQKGEWVTRLDFKSTTPFGTEYIRMDDIPFEIVYPGSEDIEEMMKREIEEKVAKKKYQYGSSFYKRGKWAYDWEDDYDRVYGKTIGKKKAGKNVGKKKDLTTPRLTEETADEMRDTLMTWYGDQVYAWPARDVEDEYDRIMEGAI